MMYEDDGHHNWCNGFNPLIRSANGKRMYESLVKDCQWCAGSKGLNTNYPQDGLTEEQLVRKHFPDVKIIG